MKGRRYRGLAALVCAAALHACVGFKQYDLGRCGNGIVEPELGEQCDLGADGSDGAGGAGLGSCTPASEPGGCQFVCSAELPCTEPGFVCGADGRCRAPSGVLELREVLAIDVEKLSSGDLDGDGLADLAGASPASQETLVRVSSSESVVVLPGPTKALTPVVAHFVGTDHADLAVHAGKLLGVLRGTSDASFPSELVSQSVSLDVAGPGPDNVLDATILAGSYHTFSPEFQVEVWQPQAALTLIAYQTALGTKVEVKKLGQPLTLDVSLPPEVPAANAKLGAAAADVVPSNDPLPCDELIVTFEGASKVYVQGLCGGASQAFPFVGTASGRLTVPELPPGSSIPGGVLIHRMAGSPLFLSSFLAPTVAGLEFPAGTNDLLAASDFDRDGTLDVVLPEGVAQCGAGQAASVVPSACNAVTYQPPVALTAAFPGDLDNDGWIDLVVVDELGDARVLRNNLGLGFAVFELATPNVASVLFHDLDGDGLRDILVRQEADTSGASDIVLHAPTASGTPGPGTVVATVNGFRLWIAANYVGGDGILDALIAGGSATEPTGAALIGAKGRLVSPIPYGLKATIEPLQAVAGNFLHGEGASATARDLGAVVYYPPSASAESPCGLQPAHCFAAEALGSVDTLGGAALPIERAKEALFELSLPEGAKGNPLREPPLAVALPRGGDPNDVPDLLVASFGLATGSFDTKLAIVTPEPPSSVSVKLLESSEVRVLDLTVLRGGEKPLLAALLQPKGSDCDTGAECEAAAACVEGACSSEHRLVLVDAEALLSLDDLESAPFLRVPPHTRWLTRIDLRGEGTDDLVLSGGTSAANAPNRASASESILLLWRNAPSNTSVEPWERALSSAIDTSDVRAIHAADINGDGLDDFVVARPGAVELYFTGATGVLAGGEARSP